MKLIPTTHIRLESCSVDTALQNQHFGQHALRKLLVIGTLPEKREVYYSFRLWTAP